MIHDLIPKKIFHLISSDQIIVFNFRLKKEREERRLQQGANPRGTITVSVNATDMFMKYYDEYEIL